MRAIPIKIYSVTLLLALFAMACHNSQPNKLVDAASPYLQAHAKDPVNWYEWGDEALQLAQSTHKPLLISIGYSACHWCHVMQEESYKDTAVARLMNENFICVKVDREERPDIDARYTDAAELLTGSAGWPLHAFALPDGRPFFAGTYYEKQRWMSLLTQISTAYKTKYSTVLLQAQGIANGIAGRQALLLQVDSNQQDRRTQNSSRQTFRNIVAALDSTNGGIKGAIKFPNPALVEYLLQTYFLDNNQQALAFAQTTLNKMAMGAIFDQAGGGFARYSTDSLWRQLHFEKMLYSNAQLLSVYAHAYQLTGAPLYKTVFQETAGFMMRDLESPEGGYYSSVNADSKDGEGLYYSWTAKEIDQLQQPLGRQLAAFYNVREQGNWQGQRSLLYTTSSAADFALRQSIDSTSFAASLSQFKNALLQEREKRNRPSIDKKIIAGWNALAITGFLDVFAALGDTLYLQKALAAARCIEIKLLNNMGQLSRYYANGKASAPAGLEDYAYCCEAFVQLYQTTFDKHWLDLARAMATQCIRQFAARGHTALFASTAAADTGYATIPLSDNVLPSANAVLAKQLYWLAVYYEDSSFYNRSRRMVEAVSTVLQKEEAVYYASWAANAALFSFGTHEVAIVGPEAVHQSNVLRRHYLPQAVLMGSVDDEYLPLLKGKKMGNKTMIYVCSNRTCKAPVAIADKALQQLLPAYRTD